MIRTFIAAILIATAWLVPAHAGSNLLLGAGKVGSGGGGGYIGPLDVSGVNTNIVACYSLRACSSALRGTKTVEVCNNTGGVEVACADLLSDATTGELVPQTIGGIQCPGTGGSNCKVRTWYDQTNGTSCGGSNCHLKNVSDTIANRPTILASSFGTRASVRFDGATNSNVTLDTWTTSLTLAQPYSMASVSCQVADRGGLDIFFGNSSANGSMYWNGTPSLSAFAGGGLILDTSTRNTWQEYAVDLNEAASGDTAGMVSGGTLVTGTGAGSGGFSSNTLAIGNTSFPANFYTVEHLIWSAGKRSIFSNLHSNQNSFWSTGPC